MCPAPPGPATQGSGSIRVRYLADAVVPVVPGGVVHRPGVLDVAGDRIAFVGRPEEAPDHRGTVRNIGGIVLPGLVNTHAHTPMTLVRGAGDGLPLQQWLEEAVWPREARLTEEDIYWGMTLGCAELLAGGVTTTCEMYLSPDPVVEAALDAGIRLVMTPGIFDLPDAGMPWRHLLDVATKCYEDHDGRDGLVTAGFGPHSAYLLPAECLVEVAESARERRRLIQVHLAETAAEGRAIEAEHGCSVPQYLDRLGVLEVGVLAAHSVWLSDEDLDLYLRHDVAVAHCPGSNGKLGSGIARVGELTARGVRVGLGTDGPASNDDLNLWEEMRLAALFARASAGDAGAVSTPGALHLATRGGADALGLGVGSLEAGRLADFVRVGTEDPRLVPVLDDGDLLAHLVWAVTGDQVTDAWVGGRQVVGAGTCRTVDQAAARREVRRRAARLAGDHS